MSIEDAIRDTDAGIAEAFNHGDLAAVVALHSADAILLGPDSPAESGGQAVEEGFKGAYGMTRSIFDRGSDIPVRSGKTVIHLPNS